MHWFRHDVIKLRRGSLQQQEIAWLCRVQGKHVARRACPLLRLPCCPTPNTAPSLHPERCIRPPRVHCRALLLLVRSCCGSSADPGSSWHIVDSLGEAGVRLGGRSLAVKRNPVWPTGWQPLPAELAALTQFTKISLASNLWSGGWQHLPPQLQELDLSNGSRQLLPAELAALPQLTKLCLNRNDLRFGLRGSIPRQLQHLELSRCRLRQVPPALTLMTQLTELHLANNPIQSWSNLRLLSQLQRLHLQRCRMQQVPEVLADLTTLTSLSLAGNPIRGGWQHLPTQLRQLDLEWCGLQQVPAELAGLVRMQQLYLDRNPIPGSGQQLPGQLQGRMPPRRSQHLPTFLNQMLGPALWVPISDFARWAAGQARDVAKMWYVLTVLYYGLMLSFRCFIWSVDAVFWLLDAVFDWLYERLLGGQL